jgi:PAS domain S-box-containing protein
LLARRGFAVIIERADVGGAAVIQPPQAFLADVYRQMPFLVIHVTCDGMVLHCNPEACRVTGYAENELIGQNLWATLFPGRLFAQVPRFISLREPSPLLKDVPLTIRTKSGPERIIGFSRYAVSDASVPPGSANLRTFLCIGVDLTDRLLDADRAALPEAVPPSDAGNGSFGAHVGNAGAIDSETVTPIAISPRALPATGPCPIEQVREALASVETHNHCVRGAFGEGETQTLAAYLGAVRVPGGKGAFAFLVADDAEHLAACAQGLAEVRTRVEELLALHRPQIT